MASGAGTAAAGAGVGIGARGGGAVTTRDGAGSPGGRIAERATGPWPEARRLPGMLETAARASSRDPNSPQYKPRQGRSLTDLRSTKSSGGFPEART